METPSSPKSGIKTKKSKRNTKSHKSTKSNIDGDEDEKPADKSTLTHNQKPTNDLICNNYVLLKQIGHGAFGEIFLSFNLRDNIEVAIKREQKRIGKSVQLKTEAKVYQSLLNISQNQDLTGSIALSQETVHGVPKYYGVGELPDLSGYYLIMEFLGPNLNELFKFCGMRKFTISTCALLAIQMINRIENVHKHSFLHRDIKPENFMIGSQDASNVIYLVDFGLSKRYKNVRNNQHIPYREGRNLIGTARYVSISTHLGIEQSRRDDLESVGYVLIFFLKGFLPWQGMKGGDKYQRIMEKKLQIPTDILCLGLPEEMAVYMNYVKSLRFEDRPDYDHLRGLFIKMLSNCISTYGIDKEYIKFDWNFEDPKNTIWNIYKRRRR
jgi:serine/threonine protein kinase